MAERGSEELILSCVLCHERCTEPKVLPCCHIYCKDCTYRLTLRTGADKPFSCPECRQDTTLPQGARGEDHFKEEHPINIEQVDGKVEAKCEGCSGGKAEAFCRQCTHFICAECVMSHCKMKTFSGHETITLDELKEERTLKIVQDDPPLVCTDHDEPMKIYCFTCSCLICRDCTAEDHLGHKHEEHAPVTKKMLIEKLEPLKEINSNLSHAVEEIQATKSEIEAQGEIVANKIKSSFAEYRKIVENHKQELLDEAALRVAQKLESLADQHKSMSDEYEIVQTFIKDTEKCVKLSTDDEIMCIQDNIQTEIDKEMKEHHEEGRSLEPVEEVDIGVEMNCAEELNQLLSNM